MRVTILGSGTAVPNAERFPSGVLVQSDGAAILVDAGPGVLRRLPQIGVGLEQITAVLLTHYHTDHCADVASLLFALRNPRYRGRPTLHLRGAAGLTRWLGLLTQAWPWLEPHEYALDAKEIAPGTFALAGLTITAVPIRHTAQSLAYRIADAAGRVFAISGDADECDGLVEVARDADLFVCEAAFPDAHYTPGHLTPSRAARAAAQAKVKTLCLTHFYPECEGHDLAAQAASAFDGTIRLAGDLMSFDLA